MFGHVFIKLLYSGESAGFMNSIIVGQSKHTIEFYYKKGDILFLEACVLLLL
jgi:hypothetical protein